MEVPNRDLRRWWPHVRPGLREVINNVPVSWIEDDVFKILVEGRAFLLAVTCGKEFAGFAVLAPDGDDFSGVKEMLIWETYAARGFPDMMASVLPFIEDRAKGLGFAGLVFHTSRKGWERAAPKLGFQERSRQYVKVL